MQRMSEKENNACNNVRVTQLRYNTAAAEISTVTERDENQITIAG